MIMTTASQIARFYGNGKEQKNGAGYLTFCPVHGNKNTPALAVTDSSDGDVDVYCHAGCSWKEIKDRFRIDGLLPQWTPSSSSKQRKMDNQQTTSTASSVGSQLHPGNQGNHGQSQPGPPAQAEQPPEKEFYIWKRSSKDGLDHAAKYFASRGITMELPVCFRWNSYLDKETKEQTHVIVAAASKPDDEKVYAVQRLFIDIEANKKTGAKMLGDVTGRGVWFNRKGDVSTVLVGEGIETVLSCMQTTGMNGVAALSTSGVRNLIFPEATDTIYLLVDSDPVRDKEQASMPGQKAAYAAAHQFIASRDGRQAFIVSPDDTCFSEAPDKLDFNDLLKQDQSGDLIRSRIEKSVNINDLQWKPKADIEQNEDDLNDAAEIAAMFERYVFLSSENKIIDSVGHDIRDSMMIERAFIISQAGKFYRYFDEKGDLKVIPLAQHWLMSEQKKVAAGLKYKPGNNRVFVNGDGRTYYNVFRFPHETSAPMPAKERVDRLQAWDLIMNQVFHRHRGYIEDFFAFTVQHPSKRAGIMPVCISHVGLGKSVIMAIMGKVVGRQNFTNGKILDVTGLGKSGTQWGDWIYNKKLSCIEEIAPEGEVDISYKVVDALKDIITNDTLPLNLKGGKNGTFPVFSNIIGYSNHRNCLKIPNGDRRIFVVDSMDQQLLSKKQYDHLYSWKDDNENIRAVFQYLMDRKISDDFVPGQAKMTRAKKALQLDSRSTMQAAFDLVSEQYPCDLITDKELSLAVAQAVQHIDGEGIENAQGNIHLDKQFLAIKRSATALVADGKRIRVRRAGGVQLNPCAIRALRNGQEWAQASVDEIKAAMAVEVPLRWISDDEGEVPF